MGHEGFIDSHVHLWNLDQIGNLEAIREHIGAGRMGIACIFDRDRVNYNPEAFAAKAEHPDRYYVFGSLDHSSYFAPGKVSAPPLTEQVDRLIAIGADGIKMLENKPTHRKLVDIPIDGPYFADHFAHLEETGFPALWHVCDPEEFWDPDLTPGWAKTRGWGYDETFRPKEQLYSEVESVLNRHPGLRIVFAHFYFLSADLPSAAALLDRHEGVSFDLAPGIEFLYNTSKNPESSREFFIRYTDRLIFGTDISSHNTLDEAWHRTGMIRRWLETDDEFRVPDGADFLLGPPEDGIIRGMKLPNDVLAKIYGGNFERMVGARPKALNAQLAAEECLRIAAEVEILTGRKASETAAALAAAKLTKE